MSALVVDSSSWISYFAGKGNRTLIEDALDGARVLVPPIVIAELASGRMSSRKRSQLTTFLLSLELIPTPADHWLRVGALRARLRALGLSLSTPDAHVAQSALDTRADLLTEDQIFRKIARHCGLGLAESR